MAQVDEGIRGITGGTIFEIFLRGGPLMWPILLCSIAALAFILERLTGLRASIVFPQALLAKMKTLVAAGKKDEATEACASDASPFARLLRSCLTRPDNDIPSTEAALEEAGSRVLYDLRKNTRLLGVVADVSPVLGLLGTVWGMIKSFEQVAAAGALGRAEQLSEGIGEALLTTAFGLTVAVPAILFYHYFRGKADGLLRSMEDACLELMETLRSSGKDT
jgi:biopolymer transport protein ExbB